MRAFCSSSFCIVEVFSVARRRYGCGPFSAVSRECDSAVFSRMTICSPLLTTVRTSKPFRAACVISFCNVPVSLVARSRYCAALAGSGDFSRMMAISPEVPMNVRGRIRKPPLAASWSSFCIVEVFVVASSLYRARSGPCDLSRSTASSPKAVRLPIKTRYPAAAAWSSSFSIVDVLLVAKSR